MSVQSPPVYCLLVHGKKCWCTSHWTVLPVRSVILSLVRTLCVLHIGVKHVVWALLFYQHLLWILSHWDYKPLDKSSPCQTEMYSVLYAPCLQVKRLLPGSKVTYMSPPAGMNVFCVLLVLAELLLDPSPHSRVSSIVQMLTAGLPHQEDHFCYVEQNTNPRRSQHEHSEDSLLCGPRHEAVHRVGTGVRVTLHQPDHLVTRVDHIKHVHKGDLQDNPEQQADDVSPPESPCDFHLLGFYLLQVLGVGPPW